MAAPQFYTPQPKASSRQRRRFTLGEANKTLPLVTRIVRDIVLTHRHASDMQAKLETATAIKDAMAVQNELESTVDRLQDFVEELGQIGCELKDYETGLIDFPCRHQGRDIYLCWRLGEDQIAYWHELATGFASRQSVASLQK